MKYSKPVLIKYLNYRITDNKIVDYKVLYRGNKGAIIKYLNDNYDEIIINILFDDIEIFLKNTYLT